jgi:hypothetical protein
MRHPVATIAEVLSVREARRRSACVENADVDVRFEEQSTFAYSDIVGSRPRLFSCRQHVRERRCGVAVERIDDVAELENVEATLPLLIRRDEALGLAKGSREDTLRHPSADAQRSQTGSYRPMILGPKPHSRRSPALLRRSGR